MARMRVLIRELDKNLSILEAVERKMANLFSDDENIRGLLSIRSEYLQAFNFLSFSIHQSNTINFLRSSPLAKSFFNSEVEIGQAKIIDYRGGLIDQIESLKKELEKTIKDLHTYNNRLIMISNNIMETINKLNNTIGFEITFLQGDSFKRSSLYIIDELRNNIIIPTINILEKELETGDKILNHLEIILSSTDNIDDNFDEQRSELSYKFEELARVCEIFSIGLDISPSWDEILSITNDITTRLKHYVGALKQSISIYI